jgi:large subunit ribosomal protein L22
MATKTAQPNKTERKQVVAHARSLRIAPRKLRLVANMVKTMRVQDALVQLQFTNKKGADIVSKLLRSAVANAEHNFSLDANGLYIASITCDGGQVLRRYMPRARGSSSPLKRRLSHLNVTLEAREAPSGKKSGRFSQLLKRQPKKEESEAKQPETATDVPDTGSAIKPESIKTNEQIKQNKVQQKRRLFNRRTGE